MVAEAGQPHFGATPAGKVADPFTSRNESQHPQPVQVVERARRLALNDLLAQLKQLVRSELVDVDLQVVLRRGLGRSFGLLDRGDVEDVHELKSGLGHRGCATALRTISSTS